MARTHKLERAAADSALGKTEESKAEAERLTVGLGMLEDRSDEACSEEGEIG